MDRGFLIKGGTVVDGTGSAPVRADVRVKGNRITQIAEGLEREGRERVIDATGCYVTPGVIEIHNHFDGPMWWSPTMDPMPGYGVTTSINGNCGFSAAPVHSEPAVRQEMVDIFSFFEDIPAKPFADLLPWDWRSWSEYKASMERHVTLPVNYGSFVGHIAMRLAVMGMDAWDRAATPDEIRQMCAQLEDALKAGALGLSTNLLDHDANDRPVPTWKADDAEWNALMDTLERFPGCSLQINVDYLVRFNAGASIEMIARLAKGRKLRIQLVGGIPSQQYAAQFIPSAVETFNRLKAEGYDIWTSYNHRSITTVINFNSSLVWAQTNNYAWGEIIQAKGDEAKFKLLSDPVWRKRARDKWGEQVDQSPAKYPDQVTLFESESGAGPVGITLAQYMAQTGIDHPSDALAEWVLDNGPASVIRLADVPNDEPTLDMLFGESNALGNVSDAGAHGQMFCGTGGHVELLARYVRDEKRLTIEQAVHILTGQPARHFNLAGRGVLKVGNFADIIVFDLDEIELRPEKKKWDVPNGTGGRTYRLSRSPAPMRLTLVNGQATFDNCDFTGRFPGSYIGPEVTQDLVAA